MRAVPRHRIEALRRKILREGVRLTAGEEFYGDQEAIFHPDEYDDLVAIFDTLIEATDPTGILDVLSKLALSSQPPIIDILDAGERI